MEQILTYWILATAFALLLVVFSIAQKKRQLASGRALMIVLALVALALFIVGIAATGTFLGPEAWYEVSPVRELLLFLLMGAGMLARLISQAIEVRREIKLRNPDKPPPKLELDHWELLYPFLSSVVCFGALIEATSGRSFDLVLAILAFQNGFFWQTVFATAKPN